MGITVGRFDFLFSFHVSVDPITGRILHKSAGISEIIHIGACCGSSGSVKWAASLAGGPYDLSNLSRRELRTGLLVTFSQLFDKSNIVRLAKSSHIVSSIVGGVIYRPRYIRP